MDLDSPALIISLAVLIEKGDGLGLRVEKSQSPAMLRPIAPAKKPATGDFAAGGFFVAEVANLGANDPEKLVCQFASRGRTLARFLFQTRRTNFSISGADPRIRVSHSERRAGV